MTAEKTQFGSIPAIIWGCPSDHVFLHVHGKQSRKEYAESFAALAGEKGWQTISFDLPEHGERTDAEVRCDVQNGMRELNLIADAAFSGWKHVGLFACSLGAYFALNAYRNRHLEQCLFLSPIVDMKWLVEQMMAWFNVTPDLLREKGEIATPIDPLRWDYYRYIVEHPVREWPHKTDILYGAQDELQPIASIRAFAGSFAARLTVSERSKHPFMEREDAPIVEKWLRESIQTAGRTADDRTGDCL